MDIWTTSIDEIHDSEKARGYFPSLIQIGFLLRYGLWWTHYVNPLMLSDNYYEGYSIVSTTLLICNFCFIWNFWPLAILLSKLIKNSIMKFQPDKPEGTNLFWNWLPKSELLLEIVIGMILSYFPQWIWNQIQNAGKCVHTESGCSYSDLTEVIFFVEKYVGDQLGGPAVWSWCWTVNLHWFIITGMEYLLMNKVKRIWSSGGPPPHVAHPAPPTLAIASPTPSKDAAAHVHDSGSCLTHEFMCNLVPIIGAIVEAEVKEALERERRSRSTRRC